MNLLQLRVIFSPPNLLIWQIIHNLNLKKHLTAVLDVIWRFHGSEMADFELKLANFNVLIVKGPMTVLPTMVCVLVLFTP